MPFRTMSQLVSRPISWLSPGRLALGKLAILDGNPQMGKSLITLDLCACLTTGRPLWGGEHAPDPADVVILTSEDANSDTVMPRLESLGADLNRVHYWDCANDEPAFRLPSNLDALDDLLARTSARLVVVDPIVAFLDRDIQIYNDQSVRQALEPMRLMAENRCCAVKMVRHINKSTRPEAIYRGGGSIGFLAACRVGFLAGDDPLDPSRKVLAQVKNNIAAPQPSLAYQIVAQDNGLPRVRWLGPCSWSANQLLSSQRPVLTTADLARDFLLDFLAAGPRTSREVWQASRERDLTRGSLECARKALQINSDRGWIGRQFFSFWCLPNQKSPLDAADPNCADLDDFLRRFREQFPPPTPLDDPDPSTDSCL